MNTNFRNTVLLTAMLALFGCSQAEPPKALSEESSAPLTHEAVEDAYRRPIHDGELYSKT